MGAILETLDTNINFWIANPNFLSVTKFKDYHSKDKSKGKESSSQIMWAIALCLDMKEGNTWINVPEAEKKRMIAEDFIGDKKFNWETKEIKELYTEYYERCLTVAEKMLRNFNLKLVDRQQLIDKTKYDMETADQLDKMILNTGKIYSQYEEIMNMFKQEQANGKTRGGIKESAGELGLI